MNDEDDYEVTRRGHSNLENTHALPLGRLDNTIHSNQPRTDVVNALNHICDHWAYMAPLNGANCLNKAVRNVGAHQLQVHDLIG